MNKSDFGYSTQTTIDQMMYFDPYRLPSIENAPEGLIGHVFMSRPSLNLSDDNIEFMRRSTKTAAFFNDPVARAAMWSMTDHSPTRWLPLIYKKAKNYTVNDYEIKATEKGGTYFGHTVRYGLHNEESKFGGTFTLEFRNDKDQSILKMMYLWMQYIYLISSERNFLPTVANMKNGVLDYAGSLYYLVTDRSGRVIKYWEKLVGVFPTKAPFSIFSWNDDVFAQDTVSIDFNYGFRTDPMDYDVLVDFMYTSGLTTKTNVVSADPDDIFKIGMRAGAKVEFVREDDMAAYPVIYRTNTTRYNRSTFSLGWCNSGSGNGKRFNYTGNVAYVGSTIPTQELAIEYNPD